MPGRPALSDERLIAALRAGDARAFDAIGERYRPRLVRFARRVLGASHGAVAEDVVQEGLLRAYRALLRDERPIDLRPWLYRLVRNCCLDELSRVRADTVELAEAGPQAAPSSLEPAVAAEGRARLRQLLNDIAVLPESQRHALLRRELDGVSHAQLAGELGLSEPAVRSLVHRARAGLTKLEVGRGTPCAQIREELVSAHDRRRRPSGRAVRHLAGCGECREFRTALRSQRRALALLAPGPLALVGGGVALKLVLGGHGAASKAGAAAAASAVAVVGVAGVAGAPEVFRSGDPAPAALHSPALPAHGIARGAALPVRTAVVRRTVTLAAGASVHPDLRLACPEGLAVADLLPPRGARVDAGYVRGTIIGLSRVAQVRLRTAPLRRDTAAAVAILCKRPDAGGSLRWPEPAGG